MKRLFLILAIVLMPFSATANTVSFNAWLSQFQQEAIGRGIRPETVYHATGNIYFDEGIIEKDQKQPESTITAEQYWKRVINERRIQRGRAFMNTNRELLTQIGDAYGVQPRYIVALLGVESDYGDVQGKTGIIGALATLAYDGRRASYFREELVQALKIIDQGHVQAENMTGSWAGAMGYCQFMPTSFFKFAQDFDGDGRIDIWNSVADAAASAANYLRSNGWRNGEGWGRRVKLTKPIADSLVGREVARPMSDWARMGVRASNGKGLPHSSMRASLILPDGQGGPAFLVYNNFNVIMQWNRSTYFATSVGMIADKLGG
jgi:membrane-bound lytic murein transglycosylase B